MNRLGFLYDASRCVGCHACQIACKEHHKLGAGDFFRRAATREVEAGGRARRMHFSGACNHCADPACTAVCPTGAMYVDADGTVQHDDRLCIGCGRCVHHCPYGAPSLNKVTGYAQKCDACRDRRAQGLEPVCVAACPTRALRFGELGEEGCSSDALPFLPESARTQPSLRILGVEGPPAPSPVPLPAGETSAGFRRDTDETFVVLGGGAAAISAVKSIRARNATAAIHLVSREERLPYCRPMLSKGLLGSFLIDRYPIVTAAWLEENRITCHWGSAARELDGAGRRVLLENGEALSYDKCVYALGADCFVPPIPGRERDGVFTLRTAADLEGIRRRTLFTQNAVVIGGGITGLEIAWELKRLGLTVTVLEMADLLMGRLLDADSSRLLREQLERAGVGVETGVRIGELSGEDSVSRVLLEDGRSFPAELVILSTGVRPSVALAQRAGLATDRAVCVNERMETSLAGVYACGDCCDRSTATWVQSVRQGEIAGANAAGEALDYRGIPEPAMVHTAGTSLLCAGDMGKQPGVAYQLLYGVGAGDPSRYEINPKQGSRQGVHLACCFRDDRLAGATLLGSLSCMRTVQEAVERHWTRTEFVRAMEERGITFHEEEAL